MKKLLFTTSAAMLLASSSVFAAATSQLSDKPIPLKLEDIPQRPKPIVELGQNPFIGRGAIAPGFVSPTGAVWQPQFIAFGQFRSALQTFDNGETEVSEWANRLDLFGTLQLTPTERFFVGFRPLDEEGQFTGQRFEPDEDEGFQNHFNIRAQSLFFEGDLGELFPGLDPGDSKSLDYGFAIGRQPTVFQDGILINDALDALTVSRSSLFLFGSTATRITVMAAWDQVHRNNNQRDHNANLYGLFTTMDYDWGTLDVDFAYVDTNESDGDGLFAGVSSTQRFGHINSTFRANASFAIDEETVSVRDGVLLLAQLSLTPPRTEDIAYLNIYWGIDNYSSAARDPSTGGPLGNVGILFAAVGLGQYGAALSNRPDQSIGAALGYQKFLGSFDRQLIIEIGGRTGTGNNSQSAGAIGARFQQGIGQHLILTLGTFAAFQEDADNAYGLRAEMLVRF